MSINERIDVLADAGSISPGQAVLLKKRQTLLPVEKADKMVENVIGTFGLPFAIAGNFRVDGRDYLVPMVVEEPSIVAGLSGAAKLARRGGGFTTEADESLLAGQIQLIGFTDEAAARAAMGLIAAAADELVRHANRSLDRLVRRGGGARSIDCRWLDLESGRPSLMMHVYVDTCDAMGANLVNTVCEDLAPEVEALTGARSVLRILSNLADRALVTSRVTLPLAALRAPGFEAGEVRDGIILATEVAAADPYRAATHNKGVMNGIDALAIATGNDWRAIEAAAHAWAARDGRYRSLTRWQANSDGDLEGSITLPLKVGTVGGSLRANPGVELALGIAGTGTARELASLMAATGLAQNFAALRALVTHGIQRGHMRLHARSVASAAAVPAEYFDRVVAGLIESGEIKTWKAQELLERISSPAGEAAAVSDKDGAGSGIAAGKVILLGEHAAVYDKHVLALPLADAVKATVHEEGDAIALTLTELGRPRAIDLRAAGGAGIAAALELILERLGIERRGFIIRVDARIPAAMGLGSSAAFAVAIIRAFNDLYKLGLDDDRVNDLAFDCEKLAHGSPSGIDNNLATYARPVLYRKTAEPRTRTIELRESPPIVVASSGQPGITRDQVAAVRRRYEQQQRLVSQIFEEIDAISLAGAEALRRVDYDDLGSLMNICHGLLNALGVSTPELEKMVGLARSAGAIGAKLTGAGGGGSIVALCPGSREDVADVLLAEGYDIILATV
jgi:hydroxymethylglutaryl-CoA reductase